MISLLGIGQGIVFVIGSVVFIAVFTAAINLAYARFQELGEDNVAGRGMRSAVVVVKPYAYEPPAGTLAALQSMLARHLGTPVRLATQPVLHYGEEALAGGLEPGPGAPAAEAHVLLFSLGATPESENHGLVVATVRDAVQRARPAPELLTVVDEAPYAARMGLDASYERRLDERRQLWRNFLAGYGLELTLLEAEERA